VAETADAHLVVVESEEEKTFRLRLRVARPRTTVAESIWRSTLWTVLGTLVGATQLFAVLEQLGAASAFAPLVVLVYSDGPHSQGRKAVVVGARIRSTAHGAAVVVAAAAAVAVAGAEEWGGIVAAVGRTAAGIGDTTAGGTAAHDVAGGIVVDGNIGVAPAADTRTGIHSAFYSVPWNWQEGRRAS
jgi:hypothetical protein